MLTPPAATRSSLMAPSSTLAAPAPTALLPRASEGSPRRAPRLAGLRFLCEPATAEHEDAAAAGAILSVSAPAAHPHTEAAPVKPPPARASAPETPYPPTSRRPSLPPSLPGVLPLGAAAAAAAAAPGRSSARVPRGGVPRDDDDDERGRGDCGAGEGHDDHLVRE